MNRNEMIGKNKYNYPIKSHDFTESFEQLTEEEKEYTYYLMKACWEGAPIILFQISYESPALFIIFQSFFSSFKPFNEIKKQIFLKTNGLITDVDYKQFITYAAKFYSNMGNYESYGKRKFIPELNQEKFEQILQSSITHNDINYTWLCIRDIIYDDSPMLNTINLEDRNGKNSYYLGGMKEEQIKTVDQFLHSKGINILNTRILMINPTKFVCLIGSIEEKIIELDNNIIVFYGEFAAFLRRVNENLEEAKKLGLNETEKKMLQFYIDSFQEGSIDKHKDSQREWVTNKQPIIEFNIGWIETYIDPIGQRAFFEGWVALTDKEKSKKYNTLVSNLEALLIEVPWGKEWEMEIFSSPDFIANDVVCFASNACPIGKNIPNYRDIKEKEGFKNISFINAYPSFKANNLLFCNDKDIETLVQFGKQALTIQVACHELLGHGSGKLLRQNDKGEFNFDIENLINPLTQLPVDKYYHHNESYESKFTDIARSVEECRADLTGLFFSFNKVIHQIFEISLSDYKDIIYSMWFLYIHRSILDLTLYNEDNKTWGQAHTQGKWLFTNFILQNQMKGQEIVTIKLDEEKNSFSISLNKEMIICYGQDLVGKILLHLHIMKATGDYDSAKAFYDTYTTVDDFYLKIRKIALENEIPHRLELYNNLIQNTEDKSITQLEYKETFEGIIESFVDRYNTHLNKDIYEQWTKYDTNFIK